MVRHALPTKRLNDGFSRLKCAGNGARKSGICPAEFWRSWRKVAATQPRHTAL